MSILLDAGVEYLQQMNRDWTIHWLLSRIFGYRFVICEDGWEMVSYHWRGHIYVESIKEVGA